MIAKNCGTIANASEKVIQVLNYMKQQYDFNTKILSIDREFFTKDIEKYIAHCPRSGGTFCFI